MPEPKATYFFALLDDIEQGLVDLESAHQIQYVPHTLSPDPGYVSYRSAFDLPQAGRCKSGSTIQADRYLLLDAKTSVAVQPVPQRRGETLYAVDETANPTAAFLALGGVFEPDCLIAWELMATSNPRSNETFGLFRRYLFKEFRKVKYALVGPEAMALYRQGWRLTQDARRNRLYDLEIP